MKGVWNFIWADRSWVFRTAFIIILVLILGVFTRSCYYQVSSGAYWKSSAEYKKELADWEKERAGLKAVIGERDKRIAEIEPKAIVFDAVAKEHKAIDADLAKKVEEVSQDEVKRIEAAEKSSDCHPRVQRICDMLRARNPKYDCTTIFKESCPGQ